MKKVVKKIALLLIVFGIGVGVTLLYTNNKYKVYEEEESKQIKKHVDTISMMLETEAGSGNYEMTTASSWPTEGYVFNPTLSKCENGSELSWDDTNKSVVMSGNVSDKCYVYFDKYNPITINNNSITSNGNSITITIDATAGTGTIAKYLYSKDNGVSYVQSANNTYTFTGLDKGTYSIKAYVQDSNGKNSEIISKTIEITIITLVDYVKSLYTGTQGANNVYYHNSSLTNGAGDNSYRYAGASESVNNFVCFGTNTTPCPTDSLYRIIGVFGNNVKLIKYDYANSNLLGTGDDYSTKTFSKSDYSTYKGELITINRYSWNYSTENNTWSESNLNKVNLNTNYLNKIGTTWSNLIEDTTWKVSGHSTIEVTPKAMYTAEITNATKTYGSENGRSKIGLMYVSDYMYAASPTYWTYQGLNSSDETRDYRAATTSNWMYMGLYEWTITPYSSGSGYVFFASYDGYLNSDGGASDGIGVRPVLYLKASVLYAGGTGTKDSPITLVV